MSFLKRILLSGIFVSLSFYCYSQQNDSGINAQSPVDTFETHLKASLISYYKKYPQEKVFVHINQQVYNSGETLWYKVYAVAYGKPTALSRIIYVRLADTAGNVIVQNKLPLTDGKAYGNIDIGQKVKTGWYRLSAFTSWMMNFEPEAYYRQKIYILNPGDSVSAVAPKETIKKIYHINFYPEGGDIIDGNLVKIAFKAYNDDGLPARVDGIIKDNTNKTLARLTTVHDGMGEFTIEAIGGSSYSAMVQFPDGSQQQIKLPQIKSNGIYLHATQTTDKIELKLSFSGPKEKFEGSTLAAFQNNGRVITYPLKLTKGVNLFELQKADFLTGILRLTVFDHDGLPQSERILFINKHDLQSSALKMDSVSFSPKGLNSFSATLKDEAGMPVNGNFSVAVTDGDAFGKDEEGQNIFSALLLSPELKGEIHDPGYYFKNESDSLGQQLDLVMLTNGWRHFLWQKVLNNESYALKYPTERSQYIAGEIMNYKKSAENNDMVKIKMLIMNQDSTRFVGYIMPDSTGRFIVKDFNHIGFSDIYLQTADKKSHAPKLEVKMLAVLGDSLRQIKAGPFTDQVIPDLSAYYLSNTRNDEKYRLQANSILLNTVNVKGKEASPMEKLIAEHVSPKYKSNREFTLDLIDDPMLNIGIIDYIRGRFPGLQVFGDDVDPEFLYRGGNSLAAPPHPLIAPTFKSEMASSDTNAFLPYFYLNEARVEFESIRDIPLVEVAMIRFMPPPVWFAPFNGGNAGAIMIYTKKQSDEIRKMNGMSDFDHYVFNGYSITREFNAPDYKDKGRARPTDNRVTLYWCHDLNTDSNGVLKFKFYNSDRAKKFRVIIQGMDNDGRLAYWEQNFQ
jgi:hypothetical protein